MTTESQEIMEPKTPTSSTKRQLRRSRTITCNVYPMIKPFPENANLDVTDQKSPPKSSCQALRHAVSALTRLDDFICEKIGAGFFSEVFKVTHRITGQVMALKMNTMTSNRHNMLREVQLLNRLNHPNILRFMGVCVHEGQLHALTEYIPGGSLEQLLANKEEELPWTQRIRLTLGLAKGLDYLHSQGYMHRDLTSKNVLVKREGNGYCAILADFGLATKIPDPQSKEKLPIVGSPYWMAPEVLNGEFYKEKADWFSVGIIMCEITARISADPDVMPRMNNFGVDYVAFSEMIEYCPLDYLQLAFKCCQVDPQKRPLGKEIIEWLEKIFRNLQNDISTQQEKEKMSERRVRKRSRSVDNLLQVNDDSDTSNEDVVITPLLIGQVMSRDDPSYVPSSTNPFASIQRYQHGRKLLGTSIDFASELSSPGSLVSPPSTPANFGQKGRDGTDGFHERRCQSLPSSPVLLRRAAERNHLESLHGSARYYNLHQMKGVPPGRARSKSTVFSEAFAHRLQTELALYRPHAESLSNIHIPETQEGDTVEGAGQNSSNSSRASSENGCCQGADGREMQSKGFVPVTTATRRRMMRRVKYQSLDGDVMGVPQIQPLPSLNTSGNNSNVFVNGTAVESEASSGKTEEGLINGRQNNCGNMPVGILDGPETRKLPVLKQNMDIRNSKPPISGGLHAMKGQRLSVNGSAERGKSSSVKINNKGRNGSYPSAAKNADSPSLLKVADSPIASKNGISSDAPRNGDSPSAPKKGGSPIAPRNGGSPLAPRNSGSLLVSENGDSPLALNKVKPEARSAYKETKL